MDQLTSFYLRRDGIFGGTGGIFSGVLKYLDRAGEGGGKVTTSIHRQLMYCTHTFNFHSFPSCPQLQYDSAMSGETVCRVCDVKIRPKQQVIYCVSCSKTQHRICAFSKSYEFSNYKLVASLQILIHSLSFLL